MEAMMFSIMDGYGHKVCEPMLIPFADLYEIKRTFLCSVMYGIIILY